LASKLKIKGVPSQAGRPCNNAYGFTPLESPVIDGRDNMYRKDSAEIEVLSNRVYCTVIVVDVSSIPFAHVSTVNVPADAAELSNVVEYPHEHPS
jgi:hypothetical protein